MEDSVTTGQVIATFEKNTKEEVRVTVDEFRGRKLMNLRVYYKDESGQFKPGKQGIALAVDRYRDLADAIVKLGMHLQSEGLIR
jgi:hypothetical protein